jgi:hypothetical protein
MKLKQVNLEIVAHTDLEMMVVMDLTPKFLQLLGVEEPAVQVEMVPVDSQEMAE